MWFVRYRIKLYFNIQHIFIGWLVMVEVEEIVDEWKLVEDKMGEEVAHHDLTISVVKCYKKKSVQKGKEYRYNSYLVPLKKDDGFSCKDEVIVLPAERLVELTKNVDGIQQQLDSKDNEIKHYEERLLKEQRRVGELEDALRIYNKKSIFRVWMHRRAGDFPQLTGGLEDEEKKE